MNINYIHVELPGQSWLTHLVQFDNVGVIQLLYYVHLPCHLL